MVAQLVRIASGTVRLYGLMTANIFGQHAFDPSKPKGAGDFTIGLGNAAKPQAAEWRANELYLLCG
jgi:hypothetical protein